MINQAHFNTVIPQLMTRSLSLPYPYDSFVTYYNQIKIPMNITRLVIFCIQVPLCIQAVAQEDNVYSQTSKEKVSYRNTVAGVYNFNIESRGKIELTDDDKDIKSMSPDGFLEITKTVFGSKRKIRISPQGNSLKKEYYEGRTSLPFEPDGKKWLTEILPELVRTTIIGAESRVNRFYRKGGVNAVLNEIELLESDYVTAHYANALVALSVSSKDYPLIISRVASTLDSDHYLTEFLQQNLNKFLATKESSDAVFAATTKMGSDHYKTEVIKEALRVQSASPEAIRSILQASGQMDSDHYKTEVLGSLLNQNNLTDAIMGEIMNASKAIESDHYKSVVLSRALAKTGLSTISYQRALESTKEIESDHYKTEVITRLLTNQLPIGQLQNLVEISSSIESDHYTTEVLKEVLRQQELSDDAFKLLVERASKMDSDHYASVVLGSSLDYPNLTNAKIISILNAAGNINSDHYITQVLTDAAGKVKSGDAQLKDAYRAAAKKISSETYYGRAMKAID
jgi:hypothetical protein